VKRLLSTTALAAAISALGVLVLSVGPVYAGNPGILAADWGGSASISDGTGNGLGGGGVFNPLICRQLYFRNTAGQDVAIAASGSQVAVGVVVPGFVSNPVTGESTGNVLGGCGANDPDPRGENLLSGSGTINGFDFNPAIRVIGAISGACRGAPSGTAGTYARIGSAVIYSLRCNEVVTGLAGVSSTDSLNVTIAAVQYPDSLGENGVTNSIDHVTFFGALVGAGMA